MSYEPNLFQDYVLLNLGFFLQKNLNELGVVQFKKKPDLHDGSYPQIVRSVYPMDFPGISNLEYPVLKLQRLSCSSFRYTGGNGVRTCNVSITYSVTHPLLKILPNLLNWVDYHLQSLLLKNELTHPDKPIQKDLLFAADRSEYRTLVNNATQIEYPFLRILTSLREDYCYVPEHEELLLLEDC